MSWLSAAAWACGRVGRGDRRVAGLDHGVERLALVGGVALDGLDEVGDEVEAALELDVDLRPGVLDLVAPPDQAVVGGDQRRRSAAPPATAMTMRATVMADQCTSGIRGRPLDGFYARSRARWAAHSVRAEPVGQRRAARGRCGRTRRRGCASRSPAARRRPAVRRRVGECAGRRAPRRARAARASASPGGDEQRVDAVGGHVAVAVDAAGDDRRAGRHRLDQHDAERLAVQRRRAEHRRPRAGGRTSRRR